VFFHLDLEQRLEGLLYQVLNQCFGVQRLAAAACPDLRHQQLFQRLRIL